MTVGDLSQPTQRANFDRDVEKAAVVFCGGGAKDYGHLTEASVATEHRACVSAIRDEALSQLSTHSRQLYAAAIGSVLLASSR